MIKTKDLKAFESAIESGSLESMENFFKGLSVQERQVYSAVSRRHFKRMRWSFDVPPLDPRIKANITVALIVSCDNKDIDEIDWRFVEFNNNIIRVLANLLPPKTPGLANAILKWPQHLYEVREMVRLQILEKPDSEDFSIAVIAAPRTFHTDYRNRGNTFSDWVDKNPDILEEDVWRIFVSEGNQELSLASQAKYFNSDDNWMPVLFRLSEEGKISRKRLLDESLNALDRGFIQFRSSWFSTFHDSLNPTIAELEELTPKYLRLLGSPIGPTVAFAINNLKKIDKANKLDPKDLIANINPCMVAQQKAVILSALSLLEGAIKKDPALTRDACMLAVDGLLHESADVQSKVIAFISKHGDKKDSELNAKIGDYADAVSASVRDNLRAWNQAQPDHKIEHAIEEYQYKNYFNEGWPFTFCAGIAPVESEDELLTLAGYCMENPLATMELERLMDGVSRLESCSEKFRYEGLPLVMRAERLFNRLWRRTTSAQLVIAKFVYTWLHKPTEIEEFNQSHLAPSLRILDRRMDEIIERRSKKIFVPMLSFPTHENGWIQNSVLESRMKIWKEKNIPLAEIDEEIAWLRLPTVPEIESKSCTEDAKIDGIGIMDRLERPEIGPNIVITIPSYRERIMHRTIGALAEFINYNLAESREYRHYMDLVTHRGSPLTYKAHELVNIGLIVPDPQCNGLAQDAMIRAIEEKRLEPNYMGMRVGVFLKSDKAKPKRLVLSLKEVARVSPLHMDAVRQVLERALQGSFENLPRDVSAVLEFYKEVLSATNRKVENEKTKTFLLSIKTGGKTAKLVKELTV
ncbi:MAG: DUF6493 family protein [Candidatus Melainabacteria bacterium]|nr:DUF6493 family protein [Candidatus Melainabacteria bacterium]